MLRKLVGWSPRRRARMRDQRQDDAEALLNLLDKRQKELRRQLKKTDQRLREVVNLEGRGLVRTRLLESRARTRLSKGPHSYISGLPQVDAWGNGSNMVRIGSYCSIAEGVAFMLACDHRVDWVSTYPFRSMFDLPDAWEDGHPATKGDIVVGHDVWIGRDVRVLSGVTIGNGAVVGASTVVTRDVRPYGIVVGNPGREVRRRFSDAQIQALEKIAWWEWPHERVLEAVHLLCGGDIERFIAEYAHERSRREDSSLTLESRS